MAETWEMEVDVKSKDDDDEGDVPREASSESEADEGSESRRKMDDDSLSTHSSDYKEDEDPDEVAARSLEATLIKNPYDYGSHVALINKLQSMGELNRLRVARENMSNMYPLNPELWLSWMRDEIKLAVSAEEKAEVAKLCERAVKDYLSVDIWLEYLQFSIGNMGTEEDAAKHVRELFERALTAVGLHTVKGAIIWEAFREFETVLFALIDTANVAERKEQAERIGNLFRRQLACPLLDMEKTREEFDSWRIGDGAEAATIDEKNVVRSYEQAYAKLSALLSYEEKLMSVQSENEKFDIYKRYLLYEKQQGDPGRITVLYERAITDLSLESTIWLDYLTYLEENIKIESILELVYQRASRNIPWCSKLWQKRIRSYEKWEKPTLEIQKLLENTLSAGFSTAEEYRNVWITYLEYLRRRIDEKERGEDEEKQLDILRNTFNRACEHLAKCFGLDGDPNCVILQYWARIEAAYNMEKTRTLWADILSQGHSATASYWLEYISLERVYGDTKHLRKLYQKALASVKDWPESIANAWINFERDEGTLEQMEFCEAKTQEKLDKVAEERQQIIAQSESSTPSKKTSKRKLDDAGKWKNLAGIPSKIVKKDVQTKPKLQESRLNFDIKAGGSQEKSESKVSSPLDLKELEDTMKVEKDSQFENDITIFISNLDYTTTEEEVRDALKPVAPIIYFKMIKDFKGRNKGYCYVQLSSTEAVEEALKLDRTNVKGRPMFVSRCDPDKSTRSSGFKYSSTLERNKLFVKGLSLTTTKEDLEDIFKIHGPLKEVRLVTYRNGHSKGLAYVEYHDEATAKKALWSTDGMEIHSKVINVAISEPPTRKKTQMSEDNSGQIKSLGGTTKSRVAFGMPKALLSVMVPRSVKTNCNNGSSSSNGNSTPSGNGVAQSMSNQDFRNMFLNKK